VILTLDVVSPPLGSASRQTFREDGGTIGREHSNTWVLSHAKVSGLHAIVSFRNGTFYIEDRSRNGVCLNSVDNRLERGRAFALAAGDRLFIDPYEIRVSVDRDDDAYAAGEAGFRPARSPHARLDADPFDIDDPFAPQPLAPAEAPSADLSRHELDPIQLLNLGGEPARPRQAPNSRDLEGGSPLAGHYRPPAVMPDPPDLPLASNSGIPANYDPLAPEEPPPPPRPAPRPRPKPVHEPPPPPLPAPPPPRMAPVPPPPDLPPPADLPPRPVERAPAAPVPPSAGSADFAAVLAGAGLEPSSISPEVAQDFGRILRVVVSGVMDVMRSRQQIKDEFRMQVTRVRPVENNPLKFSANVDDALHNLLMKHNRAYLSAVEAFEDAFADLKHHQLAMLAGMRVAFEAMLAQFDADRLQAEFDRQGNKGLVPAKFRYWDLYRERREEMAKDPEATFWRLFEDRVAARGHASSVDEHADSL